jgi:hypothetical protein
MQHGSRTSPAITLPAHQVGCRIRHRSCTFVTGRWCGYRCHASTHCTARPSRKPISRRHGVAHRVLRFVVGRRGSARRHRVTRENGRVFCHHVIGTTSKFDGPLLAALTEATREEEQEETRVARGFPASSIVYASFVPLSGWRTAWWAILRNARPRPARTGRTRWGTSRSMRRSNPMSADMRTCGPTA